MNFTFEIADETARELMQVCNSSLWPQVKTEIIKEMWTRAILIGGLTLVFVLLAFELGWFLCGWYMHRRRYLIIHKKKEADL
jgi:hypothetical protein